MGIQVKGVAKAKQIAQDFLGEIKGEKAVRAITRSLYAVAPIAARYTPVDTSTLINSQFSEVVVNGTRLTGRIGYSANYAIYVHGPNVKQTFKKPSARKEFLKVAFEESETMIENIIKEEMAL